MAHKPHGLFAGWDMPVQYTMITEEHHAVRRAVGLFDISHMGRLCGLMVRMLEVLIQQVFTGNAATLESPARPAMAWSATLKAVSGTMSWFTVGPMADTWGMVVNASNRTKIVAWLHGTLPESQRKLCTMRRTETCMIAVQGPQAVELCRGLTEADPSQAAAILPRRHDSLSRSELCS